MQTDAEALLRCHLRSITLHRYLETLIVAMAKQTVALLDSCG